MLMRSICGSLAAVGVIGGLAAALPEHGVQKATVSGPAPDFGVLPKRLTAPAMIDPSLDAALERQSLVRLAAYSTPPQEAQPASALPNAAFVAAATTSGHPGLPAPSVPDPSSAPAAAAPASTLAMKDIGSQGLVAAHEPSAAVAPSPPSPQPGPPARDAAAVSSPKAAPSSGPVRVNINRATVAELDHLPGGGRIGIAIARRRPYGAVDDLVRKRVLRASIFARIKTAITVD